MLGPMLYLIRTPTEHTTNRGRVRRMLLVTSSGTYGAIENADDRDQIPAGEYDLIMTRMAKAKTRALWVPSEALGSGERSELFIHPANFADQLKGCTAPGEHDPHGVGFSKATLERIFSDHGGFVDGHRVPFGCVDLDAGELDNLRWCVDDRGQRPAPPRVG